jgi:hypothetical protein
MENSVHKTRANDIRLVLAGKHLGEGKLKISNPNRVRNVHIKSTKMRKSAVFLHIFVHLLVAMKILLMVHKG